MELWFEEKKIKKPTQKEMEGLILYEEKTQYDTYAPGVDKITIRKYAQGSLWSEKGSIIQIIQEIK